MKVAKNNVFNYVYFGVQFVALGFFVLMVFDTSRIERAILFLPLAFFSVNLKGGLRLVNSFKYQFTAQIFIP